MVSAMSSQKTRSLTAAADQVFSSASNGVFTFAVAVASAAQSFGEIVLMITALLAILGAQRGALGTPLLLKSDQTTEKIRLEGSYALLASVTIGLTAFAAMATLGHAVGLPAFLLAASVPIVLCQDVLRYVTIAEGRPQIAATWDGVWFLGTILLLVSAWLKAMTVSWLIGGWTSFGLIALVGMAIQLRVRPRLAGFGDWIRAGSGHRIRYGVDSGLEQTTSLLVLVTVAALVDAIGTAAIRGATVLLSPVAILGGALQLIVISESTRNSAQPRAVWQAALRLWAVLAALTLGVGGVLYAFPAGVGAYLLGESFEPAQHVLPFMIVEYCASAVVFVLAVFLKTFNRSSDVMRLKVVMMVVTVLFCTCAAAFFRSATGAAAGLAGGSTLVAVFGLVYFAPWKVRARGSSVDIAAVEPDK